MLKSILGIATFICCAPAHAETLKASIFAVGETSGTPLFIQESERTVTGNLTSWSSVIKDRDGAIVMTEKAVIQNGLVISQEIEHLQINEKYVLKLENDKAVFTTFNIADGKNEQTEKSAPKAPNAFVMGPTSELFVRKHIEEFKNQRSVQIEFGVFELRRFINFKFSGVSVSNTKIEIKMKPANFIIAALVDPIKIVFDTSANKIVYLKGRTPLRQRKNGKWKPFDAEIIYH